jgi:glycosyltransferase involved in cell wall biosynthesis
MAVQTPVVCTPLPSLVEVLEDGKNGIYVPEQSPEALANALVMLAQDPDRRRTMGALGREKIEALFDTEKNVDTLAALFRPPTQHAEVLNPPVMGTVE